MDARIRREALKAAAKVALSVTALAGGTLVGCSSTQQDDASPTQDELRTNAAPPTAAACESELNSLSSTATDARTELPRTESVKTCCKVLLKALWSGQAEEDFGMPMDDSSDAAAEAGDTVVQAGPEAGADATAEASAPVRTTHRMDCCRALATNPNQWWVGTPVACSPWGPPMPPSMDHAFDMVA
jgi:hypothetical protein